MRPDGSTPQSLFAVRHVLCFGDLYEERITLWRSVSVREAVEQSENQAREYAAVLGAQYLNFAQAYQLSDDPSSQGAEIFSLLRTSALPPEQYLSQFFDTGSESQRPLDAEGVESP